MEISQTEMRVVALDGYRLALRKENVVGPAEPISAVVGGRVLGDIAKILADTEENVSLCFTRSHVRMNTARRAWLRACWKANSSATARFCRRNGRPV